MLKVGTLFSGIGSPEVALKNLAVPHVVEWACEIDEDCQNTYFLNHHYRAMYEDILDIEPKNLGKVDLIVAGWPCVDISVLGKKDLTNGKSNLVFKALEIIQEIQPKYVVLENVKNLLHKNFKGFFYYILDRLVMDYEVRWKLLNSLNFGVPQNRERVYIVCVRKDLKKAPSIPESNDKPPKVIKDILEDGPIPESFYYPANHPFNTTKPKRFTKYYAQFDRSGKGYDSITDRVYSVNSPSRTLTAQHPKHPAFMCQLKSQVRTFTTKERLRVQGFPDDFLFAQDKLSHISGTLGNAMTIPVLEEIFRSLGLTSDEN